MQLFSVMHSGSDLWIAGLVSDDFGETRYVHITSIVKCNSRVKPIGYVGNMQWQMCSLRCKLHFICLIRQGHLSRDVMVEKPKMGCGRQNNASHNKLFMEIIVLAHIFSIIRKPRAFEEFSFSLWKINSEKWFYFSKWKRKLFERAGLP